MDESREPTPSADATVEPEPAESKSAESAEPEGHDGPILLFDGVCNLCDATVQFVIDNDPKQRFRFASLQSQAARRLLAERDGPAPEELPDSVVLLDERGVHVHSDAALRTARRLRFPVALLGLLVLLPRFVRDRGYRWIARNRYRWFGRQAICRIPTAEERVLFLDADEPPPEIPPAEEVAVPEVGVGSSVQEQDGWFATLLQRLLIVYTLVYMAPFPLTAIGYLYQLSFLRPLLNLPFVQGPLGFLPGLHQMVTQPLVSAIGSIFGVDVTFQMTGSGDRWANWFDALLDLLSALLITAVWAGWRRSRPISPVVADVARTLLRYYLATTLIGYGFAKAFPLQFPLPGPDRLMQPYGDSSPMGLAWTFLGASVGYQMFGGIMELIGALLLLWRRTTLVGALVCAGVMANVVAINIFFDVPVKLFSTHLLLFAIVLVLPDIPRLFAVTVGNLTAAPRIDRPFYEGRRRWLMVRRVLKPLLIVLVLWSNVSSSTQRMNASGLWADPHPLRGIWQVESFEVLAAVSAGDEDVSAGASAVGEGRDDAAPTAESDENAGTVIVPDAERWVRLGLNPPYVGSVQTADGKVVRMRLQIDNEITELALYDRGLSEPEGDPLRIERPGEGVLLLTGPVEGRNVRVRLKLSDDDSLLISRGFHWVNDYPFNR